MDGMNNGDIRGGLPSTRKEGVLECLVVQVPSLRYSNFVLLLPMGENGNSLGQGRKGWCWVVGTGTSFCNL
jgi:hypothetical protein